MKRVMLVLMLAAGLVSCEGSERMLQFRVIGIVRVVDAD
jgi:hypothetical protein